MRLPLSLLALALLPSCSTWDGSIDPRVQAIEGASMGPAYRVTRVRDLRDFWTDSWDPWRHTLYKADVEDRALTERAIARRRANSRGRMGNIWLIEGRTVAELVAEAVTAGFRMSGYRVVAPTAESREDAHEIEVDVESFWGRLQQGTFSGVRLETWLRVRIRAPVPPFQGEGGILVCASKLVASGGTSAMIWRRNFELGLQDLVERIAQVAAYRTPPRWCVSPGP